MSAVQSCSAAGTDLGLLPEARAFSVIGKKANFHCLRPKPQRRAPCHAGPAGPLQGERTTGSGPANPSPVSTLALQRPVLSFMPTRAAPWTRSDTEGTRCVCGHVRTATHSRRMHCNPRRACRPWAEAGLCHTVLSPRSPISSFLAQNGPAIFISLWA